MCLISGFEQANKYVIMDAQGNHVGYMAEQEKGISSTMARQMFRTRRSFVTHVFDRHENEILRVSSSCTFGRRLLIANKYSFTVRSHGSTLGYKSMTLLMSQQLPTLPPPLLSKTQHPDLLLQLVLPQMLVYRLSALTKCE